jgi:hypothetical protein
MKKLLLILLLIPSVLFSAQLNSPSSGHGDVSNGVMSTSNFMLEVAKGNVPGHSIVNKFGHNEAADATSNPQDVWGGGGLYGFYPTDAEGPQDIDIKSDDAADDAITGEGAHTVLLQGLCDGWVACETEAIMDGTEPVQVDTQFIRLFRAQVLIAGTVGYNAGNIIAYIRGTPPTPPDASIGIFITDSHGQTQQTPYTVPAGHTAYFIKGYTALSDDVQTSENGTFRWMLRVNAFGPGGAWLTQGEIGLINNASSYWQYEYGAPAGPIPEKTDIRIELSNSSAVFDVVGGYDLLLVEDGF